MNPQSLFLKIKSNWSPKYTLVFATTFILGFIAHAYRFFNLLPNYDSLNSLYSSQNTIYLGRCFLILGCGISSFYDLPWIIALLSLVYIAFTTICIIQLLEIKQTLSVILTAGLLVTFPAITCTFAFMYTADGYLLAMLLASFAVLIASKSKKYIIPAALCFALSLGMYQAYILFAITLTLLFIIKKILFEQKSFSMIFSSLKHVFISGVLGALLYYISYKMLLFLQGKSLSNYNGLDTMSLSNLPNFSDSIRKCIKSFINFFFYTEKGITPYILLNISAWGFLAFCFFSLIYAKRKNIQIIDLLVSIICCLFFPFVIFFYYFVSSVDYHTLMLQSIALIFLLIILFLEYSEIFDRRKFSIQWISTLLVILIIYNFVLISNITYTTMHHSFERSTSVVNRMADRIEQLSNSDSVSKLAIIGKLPGSDETLNNFPPDMVGTVPNYIMRIQPNYVDMFRNYNNLHFEEASYSEINAILKTTSYSDMQEWPNKNSIKIINDTIVIKLGEPYYDYSQN